MVATRVSGLLTRSKFTPAKDITIEECRDFAEDLGQELFKRYAVPIYFTGKNARRPENEGLTFIRKGNYEELKEAVLKDPDRAPDLGAGEIASKSWRHNRRRCGGARRLLQRGARHDGIGDCQKVGQLCPWQDRWLH